MLDGVAAGAGADPYDIYALNARTELIYGTRNSPPGECTSLAVLGSHTETGDVLLAQNWDWHHEQVPYTLLLATADERGRRVLTLAEAGMLAKTGVNDAGLGVCLNMLACDRDGQPGGVPYHVLLRAVMESGTLAAALTTAHRHPRSASMNLLLAYCGEAIDVELVPGDAGVIHPRDGMITHANHLETPLPVRDATREWGGSTLYRAQRARHLLAGTVAGRRATVDDVEAVLRDHFGHPAAICRHVDPEEPDYYLRSQTIASVMIEPAKGRMAVSAGPPCIAPYQVVALDQVMALESVPAPLARRTS